jgi:hypothetical protein
MEVRSVCPGPSQSLLIRFCHGIWARDHGNIAIWWAIPRSVSEHLLFPSALIVFQKLRCIISNVPYKLSMSDAHPCVLAESDAVMRRVRRSCAACNEWINGLILSIALAIALMSVGSASAEKIEFGTYATCRDEAFKSAFKAKGGPCQSIGRWAPAAAEFYCQQVSCGGNKLGWTRVSI